MTDRVLPAGTNKKRWTPGLRPVHLALLAALTPSLLWLTAGAAAAVASPNPLPGGDADGDANDWTGTPLVLLGVVAVALVVFGVIFARRRGHRGGG